MLEVIHYERVNKDRTIGYVDIQFVENGTPRIIRRIQHVQHGNKKWFAYSNFRRELPNGETVYLPFYEYGIKVHNTQILEGLSALVEEYCLKNKIAEVKPLDLSQPVKEERLPF